MTPQQNAFKRLEEIIVKLQVISDSEMEELRSIAGSAYISSSQMFTTTALFKTNIELIIALKKFDVTSTKLITTTNKLTTRILGLTVALILIGVAQLAVTILQILKILN